MTTSLDVFQTAKAIPPSQRKISITPPPPPPRALRWTQKTSHRPTTSTCNTQTRHPTNQQAATLSSSSPANELIRSAPQTRLPTNQPTVTFSSSSPANQLIRRAPRNASPQTNQRIHFPPRHQPLSFFGVHPDTPPYKPTDGYNFFLATSQSSLLTRPDSYPVRSYGTYNINILTDRQKKNARW